MRFTIDNIYIYLEFWKRGHQSSVNCAVNLILLVNISNRLHLINCRLHAKMWPFKKKREIGEFSQDDIIISYCVDEEHLP